MAPSGREKRQRWVTNRVPASPHASATISPPPLRQVTRTGSAVEMVGAGRPRSWAVAIAMKAAAGSDIRAR